MIECPKCHQMIDDQAVFCDYCGVKIEVERKNQHEANTRKKIMIGVTGVVVLLLVIGMIISMIPSNQKVFYIKDNEYYMYNNKTGSALKLSDNLLNGEIMNDTVYDADTHLLRSTFMVNDGNGMYYLADADKYFSYMFSSETRRITSVHDMYYVDLKTNTPTLIDSNVGELFVFQDANIAYYLKEKKMNIDKKQDADLYVYKDGQSTLIDNDVLHYLLNYKSDGTSIYYVKMNGDLCLYKDGQTSVVSSKVKKALTISESHNMVMYLTNKNKLMSCEVGKEPTEIASDVVTVLQAYEDGTVYYAKAKDKVYLYDLVVDDLYYDYYSLGNKLKSATMEQNTDYAGILYYFNGTSAVEIHDNIVLNQNAYNGYHGDAGYENKIIVYWSLDMANYNKVYLSDYYDIWDVLDGINTNIAAASTLNVALADKNHVLNDVNISLNNGHYEVSEDEKSVLLRNVIDYSFMSYDVKGTSLNKSKDYAIDGYTEYAYLNEKVVYIPTNEDGLTKGIYVNDKKIEDSYNGYGLDYVSSLEAYVYVNYDENFVQQLVINDNGKKTQISGIQDFYVSNSGELFYIKENNLYTYSNKERLIDTNVQVFVDSK